jgi:Polyketide cyclase / dehydrase and lipid transport
MASWEDQRSALCAASREQIWAVWSDAERWSEWNSGVRSATLDGPFVAGTTGRLKPASGPTGSIEIVELEHNVNWITVTRLPGARFRLAHRMDDGPDGQVKVTYAGRLEGLLAPLYSRLSKVAVVAAIEGVHELIARVNALTPSVSPTATPSGD